jgi:lipopolysaccharide heptosyltransferase I
VIERFLEAIIQSPNHQIAQSRSHSISMRFLIIRLSSIGDIVHALPAVSALGKTFPEAEIDWVVEKRLAVLLKGNPYLRRVIELDTLGWRRNLVSFAMIADVGRGIAQLRDDVYDAAIDFQGLAKSAIIARLSRSRHRIGFAKKWLREPVARFFYHECVPPHGRRHVIEWNFALVERLGVRTPEIDQWEFPLPRTESDDAYVEQRLTSLGAKEFVVVNPGGGWQSKRWSPENFAGLVSRLGEELGRKIFLTGSPQEEPWIQEILRLAGPSPAQYFPSTLVQLVALARRARLFVGGDTGPMHLAAAVGTPIVAIFGTTDPVNTAERNGPFLQQDIIVTSIAGVEVPRNVAGSRYLEGVSVEAVLAAVRSRLAGLPSALARSHE